MSSGTSRALVEGAIIGVLLPLFVLFAPNLIDGLSGRGWFWTTASDGTYFLLWSAILVPGEFIGFIIGALVAVLPPILGTGEASLPRYYALWIGCTIVGNCLIYGTVWSGFRLRRRGRVVLGLLFWVLMSVAGALTTWDVLSGD